MIGSALAIRYYAHKPWIVALSFWAVYLIIGIIGISAIISVVPIAVLGIALSLFVFLALAIYWIHLPPLMAIIAFAIAYVLDFIIMYFLAIFGFSITSLLGGLA